MSMSQEDIEALMSGLDIASDGNSEQTEESMNNNWRALYD